jgi:uncharacterized protein YciI
VDAFLLLGEYLAPLEVLETVRPDHRNWLATVAADGRLVVAGRKASQDGSVVIVLADSLEEALRMSRDDPYVTSGLSRYDVIAFEAGRWGVSPPTPG